MSKQSKANGTSRRDFLKDVTVTSAVVASGLSAAPAVHAAGGDTIKIALVGCGGRGRGAVANCLSVRDGNVKLVALADVFEDQVKQSLKLLEKFADRIDVPDERQFVGFDAYKQVMECDVDVVMLCTPPGFRPLHYAAAVKAGKNAFMEKPCCVDAPGYRSLIESNKLADQKGLKVIVGLQRRHSQEYLPKMQQIHEGAVGDLVLLRAYWNGGFMGTGFREHPVDMSEMEFQIRNWNFFPWLSGDHIVEQHVHNIDVGNWAKNDHPVEANGMGGRQSRKNAQQYDHHFVEFTYRDGSKMYSQCRQMVGCWNSVTESVHGTKGEMQLGGNGNDGYVGEHADLFAAIRNGEKLNDGWHGATSSMTGVLGRMATYSGQSVTWDEAVAKGVSEMPRELSLDADPPHLLEDNGEYWVPTPGVYRAYS